MKTRKLGNSDLELTVIGFGAWAIGGSGWAFAWGEQDDKESIEAIHAALDNGVNWIDTAHVYGFGHSEEVVGKALAGRRDKVLVATKCGLLPSPDGQPRAELSAKSVREELEGSLRRLQTDVIDLYQIHWPNPEAQIEEAWEEIGKAMDEGKIRAAGVSNFNAAQLERAHKIRPVSSLQPPYSMLRRAIEDDGGPMEWCHAHNAGIVAYSPMLSGMLTGKVTKEWVASRPDDDWRKRTKEYQEPNLSINIDFVENTLRPIANEHGVQPGQIAVAWTLRGDLITSAIVGGRNRRQVEETARAADITLSQRELDAIEDGLKARAAKLG
ncbi:MAG: aldo/keto reductase [Sumerlaeia bacterium]